MCDGRPTRVSSHSLLPRRHGDVKSCNKEWHKYSSTRPFRARYAHHPGEHAPEDQRPGQDTNEVQQSSAQEECQAVRPCSIMSYLSERAVTQQALVHSLRSSL